MTTRTSLSAMLLALLLGTACGSNSAGPADVRADGRTAAADADAGPDLPETTPPPDLLDADGAEVDSYSAEFGGVYAYQECDHVVLENGALRVTVYPATGRLDVTTIDGTPSLLNAESRILLAGQGQEPGKGWATSDSLFASWTAEPVTDGLGEGLALVVHWSPATASSPPLRQRLELRGDAPFLLARISLDVPADSPLLGERLLRLVPLVADPASGGALFLGDDPAAHLVADNGCDQYFDFVARVFRVGKGDSLFFPPGSVANWNMGLFDSASKRSLVAGFMTFREGVGLVALDYDTSAAQEQDGRLGFTRFEGFNQLEPARTLLTPGDRDSGLFYVDFGPQNIFAGLEEYAGRYAAHAGKTLWTDIPTSWNSWGGGSGEGGLGTNINEETILANLDAMEEDFKPWGMKWFVIDNGWEIQEGNWETNTDRFPMHDGVDGMKWLAQEIESRGLIPGIWTAPFWVEKGSKIATEHPDWIADTAEMGGFLLGNDIVTLDLTHPEVLDFVQAHFHKLVHEWGYKWIKLDFSYYTLFNDHMMNPELSSAQAYYDMMQLVRETIGPDTFFLTISAMGLGFDMADGGRTTLDNMPTWGDDDDQGIKITLRTAAHRYYLSRLWSNHHDLVFYRPTIGLTLNEARCWTSAMCLMGGIIKMGDPFTMMHDEPEWLAMARRILPVYPHSARPLDMFERQHPEVFLLPVTRDDRSWHVLGLFNWGTNTDLMSGMESPEETRTHSLSRTALGLDDDTSYLLFDSWEGTCRWLPDGPIEETLEPRHERVLVIHPEPSQPAIVATSRHLLGGAVEVHDEALAQAGDSLTLAATIDTAPGHEFTVYVASAGLELDQVVIPPDALVDDPPCADVLAIRFGALTAQTNLEVTFHAP